LADTTITRPAHRQGFAAGAAVLLILSGAAATLPGALGIVPAALLGAAGLALSYSAWCGKRPTAAEAALDVIVIAVIVAARNDALALWQLPGGWLDMFRLSPPGATVIWAVYVLAALTVQARTERHLAWQEGVAVLVVPILFALLLSLSADYLMHDLAAAVTFGAISGFGTLVAIGRSIVLFAFGEILIGTLSVLISGRIMRARRLHALVLVSAVHAALSSKIADLPQWAEAFGGPAQFVCAVAAAAFAQAGLWAIVFVATGLVLDAMDGTPPTFRVASAHWKNGVLKGGIYGGVFMLLVLAAGAFLRTPALVQLAKSALPLAAAVGGALLFPLAQTIVASADGTPPFFGRLAASYRNPRSYLRGIVVGLGALLALDSGLRDQESLIRFLATFAIGALTYGGIDFACDAAGVLLGRRKVLETWRLYVLGIVLGGLVGGALGWYFDAAQIAVVTAKFWSYVDLSYPAAGRPVSDYIIYPWFNKWGSVNLGPVDGGVRLFYNESLSGVINWSIAAPLFSVNFFVLAAIFQRSLSPLKKLFSADGFKGLVAQAVRVLRWGLWMAPVINSFLRQAADPSWYNQDGAVRSVAATVGSLLLPAETFRNASLAVFTGLLAYDWLRVLIWFDHMGLRVATLVNLTFIGGDRTDEAAARFVGYAARTRIIPEGIRRFATWAPLLIPFYIPRGQAWDTAWNGAERIRATSPPLAAAIVALLAFYAVALVAGVLAAVMVAKRWGWRRPSAAPGMPGAPAALMRRPQNFWLSNGLMGVEYTAEGRGYTYVERMARDGIPIDLSRRPVDALQLRGTFFYIRDADAGAYWSIGYEPVRVAAPDYAVTQPHSNCFEVVNAVDGVRAEAHVSLAPESSVETWRIRLIEQAGRPRRLSLTSFLELGVHEPGSYVRDPDFNAMHVETWFVRSLHAVLARNRLLHDRTGRISRGLVFHAAGPVGTGAALTGYEDSRTRFIGTGDLRAPQGLEAGRPRRLDDEGFLYTFDPAASLTVAVDLPADGVCEIVFVNGYARDEAAAVRMLCENLALPVPSEAELHRAFQASRVIEPLRSPTDAWPFGFSKAGTELHLTQRTPRPWAHVLANAAGYGAVVSNEGEIHSFAGNERQNALTPFRFESVATSLPGQVVYVVDLEAGETDTATFVPFRRADTRYDVTYTLGTAVFRSSRDDLDLEMTFFVVPASRADVRILTLHNKTATPKRFRVVPYFDMVLAENPDESLGHLDVRRDQATEALLFRNRANDFRKGWAFVTTSLTAVTNETVRTRFIGAKGRDLANPVMVETGTPDRSQEDDGRRIAAFAGVVKVPAHDKVDVAIVLGQTGRRHEALITASHLRDPASAHAALEGTRAWWAEHLRAVHVETNNAAFDRLVNYWLPYQLLTARLWGRTGPNQRGGAIGFRDQLQDVIPLLMFDPNLTRQQIVLHARQQFPEGDVLKWWHTASDGRTGIGQRTHASDPHLWLPYVMVRYLAATGDTSVLDEDVPYLEGPPVPKGAVDLLVAPRPSRERGSVYDHCVRAITFALARTGAHGLPLIGTGDWNDSIDIAGILGKGESVWLGFFLHGILDAFRHVAARRGDDTMAIRCSNEADRLKTALDTAWLGDRYVLAYADSGEPIMPYSAMMAAWPALSGAVDFHRGHAALDGGLAQLEKEWRILLLTPPFDENSHPYPGRVVDYPPGVRENGGQYSHGASWTVDAYVRLAQLAKEQGDAALAARMMARAFTCWTKISPLGKSEGEQFAIYGLAPHQQAADIYDGPGYEGRGGWSWYTGAAARMLSAAYAVLGLAMEDGETVVPEDLFEPKGDLCVKELRIHGHTYTVGSAAPRRLPARSA
jgi:cyclic beta-1,2-glucan synthetase